MLQRCFEQKDQLLTFAVDWKKMEFVDFLCDQEKMRLLAYVTDIFGKFSEQNASIGFPSVYVVHAFLENST